MATIPVPPVQSNQPNSQRKPVRPEQASHGPRLHVPKGQPSVPKSAQLTSNDSPTPRDSSTTVDKTAALQSAMERARKGDESALPELRQLLQEFPSEQTGGDLGKTIVNQLLNVHFKSDLFSKEVVLKNLAEIRQNLSGPKPTPVETLLIDRVACCWLRLHLAELSTSQEEFKTKPLTPNLSQSLHRYHKQYLSSLKALADLRKMNVVIQLNLAKRQLIQNKLTRDL